MSPTAQGYRIPTPDPVLAPLVRTAFQQAASGFETLLALRQRLARAGLVAQGGKPLANSALVSMLRNPFYAGRLRWKGDIFPGNHEPLVSVELFERVQVELRTRKVRQLTQKRYFLLRGLATCSECGSLMTGESHGRHAYYRCRRSGAARNRCPAKFCRSTTADRAVEDLLRSIDVAPALRRYLEGKLGSLPRDLHAEMAEHTLAAQATLDRQDVELAEAFAAGLIAVDLYRLTAQRLRHQREALSLPADTPPASDIPGGRTLWDLCIQTPTGRRLQLLSILFERMVLGPGGISRMSLRPPFDRLAHRSAA
jgi:hypothetical protein